MSTPSVLAASIRSHMLTPTTDPASCRGPVFADFAGVGGGLPVVYFHEAKLDIRHALLTPVPRALLARGVRLIIPELPMHGTRQCAGEYCAEDHRLAVVDAAAKEAALLLDHLDVAECAVIGGSLGGLCAMAAAVRDRRIRRVCTFLAPMFWRPQWTGASRPEFARSDPGRHLEDLMNRDILLITAEKDGWARPPTLSDPQVGPERWAACGGRLECVDLPDHGHRQSARIAQAASCWYHRSVIEL